MPLLNLSSELVLLSFWSIWYQSWCLHYLQMASWLQFWKDSGSVKINAVLALHIWYRRQSCLIGSLYLCFLPNLDKEDPCIFLWFLFLFLDLLDSYITEIYIAWRMTWWHNVMMSGNELQEMKILIRGTVKSSISQTLKWQVPRMGFIQVNENK